MIKLIDEQYYEIQNHKITINLDVDDDIPNIISGNQQFLDNLIKITLSNILKNDTN